MLFRPFLTLRMLFRPFLTLQFSLIKFGKKITISLYWEVIGGVVHFWTWVPPKKNVEVPPCENVKNRSFWGEFIFGFIGGSLGCIGRSYLCSLRMSNLVDHVLRPWVNFFLKIELSFATKKDLAFWRTLGCSFAKIIKKKKWFFCLHFWLGKFWIKKFVSCKTPESFGLLFLILSANENLVIS